MKPGRNDPCPCGSGRKFKHCCLASRPRIILPIPAEVQFALQRQQLAHQRDEAEHRRKFGSVRPIIHGDFQDHKVVVVGNKVAFNKKWKTFPDFLVNYLQHCFGSGWGKNELRKAAADKHPAMQWYQHFCAQQKGIRNQEGLYEFDPDLISSAFIHLAYDLYVLDDQCKLQKELLRRLRRPEHFFGARYELFVAATFIRAGWKIEFEDETDSSRKHPEFIATDPGSGICVAVEAKAKHRAPGQTDGLRVRSLLEDAAEKVTDRPYMAWVEVNLPAEPSTGPASWMLGAQETVNEVVQKRGRHTFDIVFFTNVPYQYAESNLSTAHVFAWNRDSRIPLAAENRLVVAISQYGNIPQDFPALT